MNIIEDVKLFSVFTLKFRKSHIQFPFQRKGKQYCRIFNQENFYTCATMSVMFWQVKKTLQGRSLNQAMIHLKHKEHRIVTFITGSQV